MHSYCYLDFRRLSLNLYIYIIYTLKLREIEIVQNDQQDNINHIRQ